MKNATIKIESISPTKAEQMLAKMHHGQRALRESWVNRLAGEMKEGKFGLSCDALVLVDDTLMNGQHRLNAVIKSGVPSQFLVLRSEDPNIYRIIDAGLKRNVSDVIGGDHRSMISSMASWVLQYDRKTLSQHSRRTGSGMQREILRSQTIEFIDANRHQLGLIAATINSFYCKRKIVAPSLGAAFAFLANRARKNDSGVLFIQKVYEGGECEVVRNIRDKLINNRISKRKWQPVYLMALLIKAFLSWEENPDAAVNLKMQAGEDFPQF